MSPRDRSLVTIFVLIATGRTAQLIGHLGRGLDYASLFRDGEEYKTMELPTTPSWKEGMLEHADRILLNGADVGISSGTIYSYFFREALSMGCIDLDQTALGTELVVQWGDFGKRMKDVRVTVDRFPYLTDVRNSEADVSKRAN